MKNHNKVFFGKADFIGTRPDASIQALTNAAVSPNGTEPVETAMLQMVLDYMTWLEMKAAVVDHLCVQVVNLPVMVKQAVQLAEDTARAHEEAMQPNQWMYNVEGHVCRKTNRKAMTVAQVIELQNKGDVYSYTYDPEASTCGLDPWRLVDSINPFTSEPKAELWFDNGGHREVSTDEILYVQQPKAKK
jgi:hypothetical protein